MMKKTVVTSMIVVVFLAGGTFASALHDQITSIGMANAIDLAQGDQVGQSLQNLVVDNQQDVVGLAGEHLFASIGQSLGAGGNCAQIGALQELEILGNQMQSIDDCVGPLIQGEALSMNAVQSLARTHGVGGTDALHTIVLNAGQGGANAGGSVDEVMTVMGMQQSVIDGLPGATGAVQSGMSVLNTQTQAAALPVTSGQ
jgi:hypothetical protein